ncbi:MAG: hypothetical protein JXQ96_14985 [Cyclobacteriaceae bacterium]
MKLTKTQYAEINKLFESVGRQAEEFTLIKRKGRIHITENASDKTFIYFKKKSAGIDPVTQRLEDGLHFLVSHSDMEEVTVASWEEVMKLLYKWLKPLS